MQEDREDVRKGGVVGGRAVPPLFFLPEGIADAQKNPLTHLARSLHICSPRSFTECTCSLDNTGKFVPMGKEDIKTAVYENLRRQAGGGGGAGAGAGGGRK